ncbi:hypothetical protein L1887_20666 [Cichorium endivia]|nr:hypothetical protein L1887_20666 [Cichorium endivia]
MATKYLHSLADENPDLRKQIGCMTGVFHIFNRNQIVTRSRVAGHGPKRLPHGGFLFNNGTPERESSVVSKRSPNLELHSNKHFMEKHRVSTESFKESLSSWSPPSPFSYESSASQPQNLDLRDIVKDSMYREARGLSHNVLVKLQEPNWQCNQLSRSKSCQLKDGFSKIYPRFSCDGRETDRLSIKDYGQSQTSTPKELPRLSLDGRERSIRTLNSVSLVPIKPYDSKSNLHSRNPKINDEKALIQTRPPSVVAKLMGLETFPNSTSINDKDLDLLPKSLKETDDCKSIKIPNSIKEPTSPCWKNPDLKPISRVLIEPAPWKHRDGGQNSQKQSPRVTKSSSVYNEVDKRLKNLEFEESGKDLRALKQILEAMQAVEARKGERVNTVHHQNPPSENVSRGQESRIVIMKPEKGIIENKAGKDPITGSKNGRKQSESRCPNRRKQNSRSTQEKSTLLVKVGEEYPSPVSVLDESVYMENSPSPVKYTPPHTQKSYAKQKLDENVAKDQNKATNDMISGVTSLNNREKLQKVKHLVQKLKRLNSSHDETHTDYIASLCENRNPNNRYISEIFLASGLLLRDLESFEFHSSDHPINPGLFLVLERTKFSNQQQEKFNRKLMFDAVNEILVEKLDSVSLMVQNPRELLREVCLEIERMQLKKKSERCDVGEVDDELTRILQEDLGKRSESWRGFYGGSPVVAMEVEWLIFRDLINELVMSEAANSC